jgi:CheY-like chemotaxis protein
MYTILFVQSDPKLVQLYLPSLSRHFAVDPALDGLSALRKLRLVRPGLIISDYHLPHLSGLALLKFVRSTPGFGPIPFIFLADNGNNRDALSLGANDWLEKSQATPDTLIDLIYRQIRLNQRLLAKII